MIVGSSRRAEPAPKRARAQKAQPSTTPASKEKPSAEAELGGGAGHAQSASSSTPAKSTFRLPQAPAAAPRKKRGAQVLAAGEWRGLAALKYVDKEAVDQAAAAWKAIQASSEEDPE